jgi:hypothetical protein
MSVGLSVRVRLFACVCACICVVCMYIRMYVCMHVHAYNVLTYVRSCECVHVSCVCVIHTHTPELWRSGDFHYSYNVFTSLFLQCFYTILSFFTEISPSFASLQSL